MPPLKPQPELFVRTDEVMRFQQVKAREGFIAKKVAEIMPVPEQPRRGLLKMFVGDLEEEAKTGPSKWSASAYYKVRGMEPGKLVAAFLSPMNSGTVALFTRQAEEDLVTREIRMVGPLEPRAVIARDGSEYGNDSPLVALSGAQHLFDLSDMSLRQREKFVQEVEETIDLIATASATQSV